MQKGLFENYFLFEEHPIEKNFYYIKIYLKILQMKNKKNR